MSRLSADTGPVSGSGNPVVVPTSGGRVSLGRLVGGGGEGLVHRIRLVGGVGGGSKSGVSHLDAVLVGFTGWGSGVDPGVGSPIAAANGQGLSVGSSEHGVETVTNDPPVEVDVVGVLVVVGVRSMRGYFREGGSVSPSLSLTRSMTPARSGSVVRSCSFRKESILSTC